MKIKAVSDVQIGGHIYHRGDICDWQGPATARIAANFVAEDGSRLVAGGAKGAADEAQCECADADAAKNTADGTARRIERTVAALKRAGIISKLDEMHVSYSPASKTEYLAKLLLTLQGEIEE